MQYVEENICKSVNTMTWCLYKYLNNRYIFNKLIYKYNKN